MQLTDPVGVPGGQTGAQGVGEEMVVAVPPALVVERDHEQVLALEGLQHRLTVGTTGQGVAQAAGQLVEHRGVEKERPHVVRLPVQNLLDEVVEDESMASGEGLHELGDISGPAGGAGMGPGRQRGQLQPGRPPSVRASSAATSRGLQPQPHHLVEELLRFVGGEPEIRGPHLHELATRTQPRQRERRVGPSRHRQRDLRRQVVQQEGHRLMDGGSLDHVEVVERHHRGTGEDVEIIDQADQDGIRRRGASGLQQGQRVDTGLGFGGLDRGHEMGQKPSEVGVARVESQPGHPALRVSAPPATEPGAWSCRTQPVPRRGPAAAIRLPPRAAGRRGGRAAPAGDAARAGAAWCPAQASRQPRAVLAR